MEETVLENMTENMTENMAAEEKVKEECVKQPGFRKDNRGVGVIEIVLILVILIGLVLVFKDQITAIVNNAFTSISGDAGKILN